jgi:predicted GNAT family N-acyltransferase
VNKIPDSKNNLMEQNLPDGLVRCQQQARRGRQASGTTRKFLHEGISRKDVQIKRVISTKELRNAFAIRLRVFVKEQGVPEEIELDRDDKRAVHFLATLAGKPVGTARVVIGQGSAKIGRMAVLKSYRRKGVGRRLLTRALAAAKRRGARKIYLHAQVPVIRFYERLGFFCVGPVFDEAGIQHRKMIFGAAKRAITEKKLARQSRKQSRR